MADKPIQEQFGGAIIDAVRGFARADIPTVAEIEQRFFQHVSEDKLRIALAETLYGARWIYKLGLALLVENDEQMAHVRCQVIDYGSCCEGLLYDAIRYALHKGITTGKKQLFEDTRNMKRSIAWSRVSMPP